MPNPYVYKLVHKETSQYYIGYRCANKVAPELDLGIKYKTSSDDVRELGFDNFNYQVIVECFLESAAVDAYDIEQELIEQSIDDPLCLNRHYIKGCYARFSTAGKPMSEKQKEKLRNKVVTDEARRNMSIAAKSKVMTEEHKRKISEANKGNQSMVGLKHTDETKQKMSAKRKGVAKSEETKAKMRAARAAYLQRIKEAKDGNGKSDSSESGS